MAALTPAAGLVLAAGAGTRYGVPKALARAADGTPWLALAVERMREAGLARVTVVLGAAAEEARPLVPAAAGVDVVVAEHWAEGMGASLRAGMRRLEASAPPGLLAAAITLVDLPELPVAVLRRLLDGAGATTLRRASYSGRPGHPVVVGRQHWADFAGSLHGDTGGRGWLDAHGVRPVECGDLWSGRDVDTR
ncbi:nucleotidyltransferase family protein [Gryllotalpicola ginsengisoli]|uniref:nucleotidyltransferase family protein n=1 Tax=Gryllotalpicola ginsengisoli TaxID=444608 RepID=UPI0003B5A905|nr:NTP transferase domain-containing protein [Gryllotalpicola ginsengisoli]